MRERKEVTGKTKSWISLWISAAVFLPLLAWNARGASITSFSPAFGQPGNVVTILGSGLSSATNFEFNSAAPTLGDFVVVSDSELQAVVPFGATSGPLSVGTTSGSATSSSSFLVAPEISGFTPQSGDNPTVVYILGTNFIVGNTTVTFTGASPVAGAVTSTNGVGVVAVTVPTGAGDGPITVTTSAGSATSASNFTASSLPTITSFSPTAGAAGATVTINGGNFYNVNSVKFGGSTASATVVSTTQISATVPSGASTGAITVTTSAGSFTTSSNFLTGTGPIITGFSPTIGNTNMAVSIAGLNLGTETSVTFNGHSATVSSASSTNIQARPPSGSGTGPIEVVTPQGSTATPTNFTNTTAPVVGSFSPVNAGPGTNVVLTGFNFTGTSGVKFGSGSATYTVVADTQITANVPGAATTGPIEVTSSSGSFTTSSNFFVSGNAPVISSFSPSNGVRGEVVTINGGNFTNLSSPAVEFNGASATYTPLTSTTVIYATVPSNATSGLISVINGSGAGDSASLFYLQPWITNATASGIVNSSVIIDGRNLTNATAVSVNGVNYSFTNSATQIVAIVPSNATTGAITVTTPGGIFINTNSFVVLPNILSFSPTIGPAGTVVTIAGTSLFDVTNVQFNGSNATPFNVTTNQLQVDVPTSATPGPIAVFVPGGSNVTSSNFTATRSSLLLLTKTVNPVLTVPGSNVTYTLTVTNEGPSPVTSVMVTDNIPTGFTLTSATTSVGAITSTNNNMVIASLGILSNFTSATITVTGTSPVAAALTNTANLGFPEGNLEVDNDFAYAYAYFITAAQRTLSIAAPGSASGVAVTWPLSPVTFTLQVSTNLSQSNGWQSPANAPFVTNGVNEFTNAPPYPPAEYFRLLGP